METQEAMRMTRKTFIHSVGATAICATMPGISTAKVDETPDYDALQKEIDAIKAADYTKYRLDGNVGPFRALQRLEDAFDRVLAEVQSTKVTDKPVIWHIYNMGIVVKTPKTCFAIDPNHRRVLQLEPLLDFALITHNHGDHCSEELYQAMNGAGKTVISNFKDNYGARSRKSGGYTRAQKTFRLADVEIKTALTDHNDYLIDFTTTFEIRFGDFVFFHSGDCSSVEKLNPSVRPDLWFVHPRCGLRVDDGVRKFAPKMTAIIHLNELGHDRWRWNWSDGLTEKSRVEAAGGKAIMPLWGDRITSF